MPVNWIEYKGKKILLSDLSNSSEEEQIRTLEEGREILEKQPSQSVLSLLDTTDTETTVKVNFILNRDKSLIKEKIKAVSVVGCKGIQHWIASIFLPGIHCVATREEAKKWLVGKETESVCEMNCDNCEQKPSSKTDK